jgi:hypothetical protein
MPFAGGSCIATIASSCGAMCLQGCTIVRPDSASDCKWQITRAASHSVVADVANGSFVNIIQESGDFSECVCPCALSRKRVFGICKRVFGICQFCQVLVLILIIRICDEFGCRG